MMNAFLIFMSVMSSFSENRTNLFKSVKEPQGKSIDSESTPKIDQNNTKKARTNSSSNLPTEYLNQSKSVFIEESPVVLPSNRAAIKFKDVKIGDLISATIQESVFAYNDSKVPVRALITSGNLKGSVLLGEASLEKNSKRIQVEFRKFRDPNTKEIFQIQASLMDDKGVFGVEGKLISSERTFFAAELLSAGAAGYADATITRDQNLLGNSVESKNEDTFAKKALTSALSRSADRFADKLKQAPEYSVLEGPIQVQILVLEQPTLNQ